MKTKVTPELAQQLTSDPAKAQCPECGQRGFWDNRANKKNPKAPDYKCKNRSCETGEQGWPYGVYVRDFPAGTAPAKGTNGARPSVSWKQMKLAYHECCEMALHEAGLIGAKGIPVTAADVAAMTATLMITRDKVNCWPEPKPRPAPPAPPPPPPPEFEDHGDEEPGYGGDLPFD